MTQSFLDLMTIKSTTEENPFEIRAYGLMM